MPIIGSRLVGIVEGRVGFRLRDLVVRVGRVGKHEQGSIVLVLTIPGTVNPASFLFLRQLELG